jgi:hypothetical protein
MEMRQLLQNVLCHLEEFAGIHKGQEWSVLKAYYPPLQTIKHSNLQTIFIFFTYLGWSNASLT